MNLADGEDSEKVADIVGDAGVVLLNRAPGTAILNERMVFVGMDEAGSGALQGHALAEYFWETDHGTDIRYLLFQGMPGQENTDARSGTAVQSLLDDGFCPIAAADYQVCGFSRERARQAMAALLEQGVDFDCVICDNDEMALGVIEALDAAGRDPGAAPIVSVDHTAEGAAALESGKLYMTVDQNPEDQARAAVAAAVNLARGRAYDDRAPGAAGERLHGPGAALCTPGSCGGGDRLTYCLALPECRKACVLSEHRLFQPRGYCGTGAPAWHQTGNGCGTRAAQHGFRT